MNLNKDTVNKNIKYRDKGLSGLSNLGNTCFLNACMQILSHTYELNDLLNLEIYKKRLKNIYDSALILEWDELRKILWNENCIVTPNKFVKTVQKLAQIKGQDLFTGYDQNDLPEFLIFVIDCFHNSLAREVNMNIVGTVENDRDKIALLCFERIKQMYVNDYSEIWNMFYGIHVSQLKSIETAPTYAKELEDKFSVTALDIQTANAQFDTGTFVRNIISYAVSITLLIVAGFGIYNILNMLIYEKINDIAILKATGFSSADVRWIFISQAIIIGVIGGVLGLLLGYFVSALIDQTPFNSHAIPNMDTYPVNYNPTYYFIGIAFAMLSTYLAGYFPSRKAGKIDPVDIIRGQ